MAAKTHLNEIWGIFLVLAGWVLALLKNGGMACLNASERHR